MRLLFCLLTSAFEFKIFMFAPSEQCNLENFYFTRTQKKNNNSGVPSQNQSLSCACLLFVFLGAYICQFKCKCNLHDSKIVLSPPCTNQPWNIVPIHWRSHRVIQTNPSNSTYLYRSHFDNAQLNKQILSNVHAIHLIRIQCIMTKCVQFCSSTAIVQ